MAGNFWHDFNTGLQANYGVSKTSVTNSQWRLKAPLAVTRVNCNDPNKNANVLLEMLQNGLQINSIVFQISF